MAKEKKAAGADKKRNSSSNKAYTATHRRYFNKLKKVRRHVARTGDVNAASWLKSAEKILAMDYKRGSETVRKLHATYYV